MALKIIEKHWILNPSPKPMREGEWRSGYLYQSSCSSADNDWLDCCRICQNFDSELFCLRLRRFSQRHLCTWPKGHCCCWSGAAGWSLPLKGTIFDRIFQALVRADGTFSQNGKLLSALNSANKFNSIMAIRNSDRNINIVDSNRILQRTTTL